MRTKTMWLTVAVLAGAVCAEETAELTERADKPWRFRIGPVMSPRVRVRTWARAAASAGPVGGVTGTTSGTYGTAVPPGPGEGPAERVYTDGYVKPDEATGDGDAMDAGAATWNWGARDAGAQYRNGKMEFRTEATEWTETVSTEVTGGGNGKNFDSGRDILLGVEAAGDWMFWDNRRFELCLTGGFRFYGSDDRRFNSRYGESTTITRTEYRYVDRYDASKWTTAPTGAYDGSAGGPGRLLTAEPESRSLEAMGSSTQSRGTDGLYTGARGKLRYQIWDLRLGPTFGWNVTEKFSLRAGAYGLLGLVDASLKTPVGSGKARDSKCDAVFGVALGASAQYLLTDSLYLQAGAEYDWWTDKVNLATAGARSQIELSDFTVTLSVGLEF